MKQVFLVPFTTSTLATPIGTPVAALLHTPAQGGNIFDDSSKPRTSICGANGTIRNLFVKLETVPGGSTTRTFTVYKNGSATALTVTHGSADSEKLDSTNSVTVAAGDTLRLFTSDTGTPATTKVSWSIEFESDTANQNFITGSNVGFLSNTARRYFSPIGVSNPSSIAGAQELVIPHACTIKAFYLDLDGVALTGSQQYTFSIFKNGSEEVSSQVVMTAIGGASVTGLSISLSAGDRINLSSLPANTPTANTHILRWGIQFESTTDGNSIIGHPEDSHGISTSATEYGQLAHGGIGIFDATESTKQVENGSLEFILKNLTLSTSAAPGSGKSINMMVRQNTADSALNATIADLETSGNDTSNELTIAVGDLLSIESNPTGTPTITNLSYSATQYIAPAGGATTISRIMPLTMLGLGN